jgi:hypothetical protein
MRERRKSLKKETKLAVNKQELYAGLRERITFLFLGTYGRQRKIIQFFPVLPYVLYQDVGISFPSIEKKSTSIQHSI